MKSFLLKTFLVGLVVILTMAPQETEANPGFFIAIARALGIGLVKNTYYARCNTRNLPKGITCPGVVFGYGLNKNQAQKSAKAYAVAFGHSSCATYVGHCEIRKFYK